MFRNSAIPALIICNALVGQSAAPGTVPSLSLQDAIRTSLENNLQVEIAKEAKAASKASVNISEGAFDWTLTGNVQSSRQEFADSSSSTGNKVEGTLWGRSLTLGAQKPFGWGGNLQLSYAPTYSYQATKNPPANTLLPYGSGSSKGSGLSATYTQSLLRGFGRDATEVNVIVARKGSEAAEYQYRKAIIALVASTESLYWDVVYAQRNLDNKKQALELAQKQLKENQIRVQVGTMAPIEVTSAEAAVAQQDQAIIAADAQLRNAKDALIRALYPSQQKPENVVPTDEPNLKHIVVDEPAGEQMALDRRVELKAAKLDQESKGALLKAAENHLKPQLDAYVGYTGDSYQYTSLGSVNDDLAGFKYPGYVVGLNLSIPLENRTAKGNLAAARANARSSELSLRDQELGIRLEVRQAFRNIEAAEKGVDAAKKTLVYRQKDLEAEQKKFDNGMSTNFLVLSKQNDLDTAKAAELQAEITYAKAVTALEAAVGNLLEARGFQYPD
jgi:outer membrane protein TolC